MSARQFEIVLAKLYADEEFRKLFLSDPARSLAGTDLTEKEKANLLAIDRVGLIMAAHSYSSKKEKRKMLRPARALLPYFRG